MKIRYKYISLTNTRFVFQDRIVYNEIGYKQDKQWFIGFTFEGGAKTTNNGKDVLMQGQDVQWIN
jgi:hypothetical protein